MISLNNVTLLDKNKKILNNINASFNDACMYAILGNNGSGKSSLLRIISTLQKPSEGNLFYNRDKITKNNKKEYLNNISFIPQKIGLIRGLSVKENIIYFSLLKGCNYSDIKEQILYLLDWFNQMNLITEKVGNLSGGQYQLIGIIIGLISNPKILIMDEPFNNLGIEERRKLSLYFQKHLSDSIVLISTHILDEIANYCSHVLCIKNGEVTFFGERESFLSNSNFIKSYNLYAN